MAKCGIQDPFQSVTELSDCADAFLKKLDLANDCWQDLGGWIFRGQNDSCWLPIPSILRERYDDAPNQVESALVSDFMGYVNRMNLPIPASNFDHLVIRRPGIKDTRLVLNTHRELNSSTTLLIQHLRSRSTRVSPRDFLTFPTIPR